MARDMKSYGSGVLVPVVGAFAEMSSDVGALADVIASTLASDHTQLLFTSAMGAKGTCKQRTRAAWGAHRGWARLLLDRRGLIVHGPRATRSARNSTTRSSSDTATTTANILGGSTLAFLT